MCATTDGTLTLAGMLTDPLIRAVMRSDGISEHELETLLSRMKDRLESREPVVHALLEA